MWWGLRSAMGYDAEPDAAGDRRGHSNLVAQCVRRRPLSWVVRQRRHMALLFVIEDTFAIKERGVIAVGNLADSACARYRVGDTVEIRRRDGSVVQSVISGIPMGMLGAGKAEVLLRGLSGSDVGVGDQVWVSVQDAEPGAAADGGA